MLVYPELDETAIVVGELALGERGVAGLTEDGAALGGGVHEGVPVTLIAGEAAVIAARHAFRGEKHVETAMMTEEPKRAPERD
jgi:hypothetical protein